MITSHDQNTVADLVAERLEDGHHILFIDNESNIGDLLDRVASAGVDGRKTVRVDMRPLGSPDEALDAIVAATKSAGLDGAFMRPPEWPADRYVTGDVLMASPVLLILDRVDAFLESAAGDKDMLFSWLRWMRQNQTRPPNLLQLMTATDNVAPLLPVGMSHVLNDVLVMAGERERG